MIKPISRVWTFAISPPPFDTFFPHNDGNLYLIDSELYKHTGLYTSYHMDFPYYQVISDHSSMAWLNRVTITIAVISVNEVF